jgi:hypothetical protein
LFLPTVFVLWPAGFLPPAAFLLMGMLGIRDSLGIIMLGHGVVFSAVSYGLARVLARAGTRGAVVWAICGVLAVGSVVPMWGIVHEFDQLQTLYEFYFYLFRPR